MVDGYYTAQICPNGHAPTSAADLSPNLREAFCARCGEPTSMNCGNCEASIRGSYAGHFSTAPYVPPAYCHACGKPFPWTERKIVGAIELVQAGGDLSDDELRQVQSDLTELTKDTPKAQAAAFRFKKAMAKAGSAVASGVRDIVVDIISEAARKVIWP